MDKVIKYVFCMYFVNVSKMSCDISFPYYFDSIMGNCFTGAL
jgi:hypothetical protein